MSWILALLILGVILALFPIDGTIRNVILAIVLVGLLLSFFPGHFNFG